MSSHLIGAAIYSALITISSAAVSAPINGEQVLQGLNVSEAEVEQLNRGDTLAFSDETYESTARELAADAIVLVKTDLNAVARALSGSVTLIPNKIILDHAEISSIQDFSNVLFDAKEMDEVKKLIKAKPGKDFNFSTNEHEMLDTKLSPLRKGSNAEQVTAASNAMREILIARYNEYRADGLNGIEGYSRSRKPVDVGRELLLTTETFKPFANDFPTFYNVMANYPNGADCCEHYFRWLKFELRKRPTFALSHTMIEKTQDYILYTERIYFASNTMNSLQITLSWLPYDENTYMGLAMSASADILDSMFGKMLRPLGRNKAKDLVADTLDEIKAVLEEDGKSAAGKH